MYKDAKNFIVSRYHNMIELIHTCKKSYNRIPPGDIPGKKRILQFKWLRITENKENLFIHLN